MTNQQTFSSLERYLTTTYSKEGLKDQIFFIVTSTGSPRWLLPNSCRKDRIKIADIIKQWKPYSRKAELFWNALILLYKYGLLKFIPSIQKSVLPMDNNNIYTVYIGTPGLKQKLVLSSFNKTLGKSSVVKIAIGSKASQSIKNEYYALLKIENIVNGPRIIVKEKDCKWFSQTFVDGKLCDTTLSQNKLLLLASLPKGKKFYLYSELKKQLEQVLSNKKKNYELITLASKIVCEQASNNLGKLNHIAIHGDFAPWNMKFDKDNRLYIFDWESYEEEGIPLYDLCYYYLNLNHLFTQANYSRILFETDVIDRYLTILDINLSDKIPLLICSLLKIINNALKEKRYDFTEYLLNLNLEKLIK